MSHIEPTIRIFFVNLAAIGDNNERLPLSHLDMDYHHHIHGGLRIEVQGRFLPYLGYFGADDVCFSLWLGELESVYNTFEEQAVASYTFDEGEQGQPAFLFEKEGGNVFLSIVDSEYSEEGADSNWQRVKFLYEDFRAQYLSTKAAFLSELDQCAPDMRDRWVKWALPA